MKTRRTPFRFSRNTLVRRGVTALVIASLITVLGVLGLEVRHQLTHLANSASENVQWTLGQAETEIIALELATVNALHADADDDAAALDEVRLRFDIAYSRIETLQNAQVLADLRRVQDIGSEIQAALDFREAWVPVIDGSELK